DYTQMNLLSLFFVTWSFSMKRIRGTLRAIVFWGSSLSILLPVFAQDSNILHPIEDIERRLLYEPFEVFTLRNLRLQGNVPKRAILRWSDGVAMQVKWKRAERGGWAVNNQPRYEIAAYELQKLFLDPGSYVVPPTIGRSLPLDEYRQFESIVEPTFRNTNCVFLCLQYWLEEVTAKKIYDKKRFNSDTTYARHLGNMNILSYLIKHNDSNVGNFLISKDPGNPRVFAVDNGFAFGRLESTKGYKWRNIRVKYLPEKTIDRLRRIQEGDLVNALGVVAQYEIKNGQLIPVVPTHALDDNKGVRISNEIIQFGLTKREIRGVFDRMKRLLKLVDSGKIKTF
ncbi:MAG: hypothetical protein ACE5HS_20515, partial [bacterium]